jgi:hypothetical protein
MSTFEPVIVRTPLLHEHDSPRNGVRCRHGAATSRSPSPHNCKTTPANTVQGHRRQGAPSRSPGLHGRQAAAQRPEDRRCAMRGLEHLRRVLPREAYVSPDPPKRLYEEQSTRRRVMEYTALLCIASYTWSSQRHVPLLFIERFEDISCKLKQRLTSVQ